MFFIGIFGIDQRQKQIGRYNNTICPSCGAMAHYDIYKSYSYFHIFFIPTFRWNIRYYVKSSCCSRLYELDATIGQQYERGAAPEIKPEHLHPAGQHLPYNICSSCGARFDPGFSFCPYCGKKT